MALGKKGAKQCELPQGLALNGGAPRPELLEDAPSSRQASPLHTASRGASPCAIVKEEEDFPHSSKEHRK